MKKKIVLLLTAFFINNNVLAENYSIEEKNTNFSVTPSIAYRYDVFKFSIPDNIFLNKKLSELIWKNHIIQPGIKFEIEPQPHSFTLLAQTKYGYILNNPSECWDLDWHVIKNEDTGNITTPLESKTKSTVRGNILDLSAAVGYSVNLFESNLLTFYVGFDYTDYRNKKYGLRQFAFPPSYLERPFHQLISKYYFKNKNPWIGLSLNTPVNERFTIIPTVKFYSFNFVGKGYWLLRTDYGQPSFKQNAKGIGLGLDMDFLYNYNDKLDFKINLETKKFKMKKSKQQKFIKGTRHLNDYVDFTVVDKLIDLSFISSSISFGVKYKF